MAYNPMMDTGHTNPMEPIELFWKHVEDCKVCQQHPQSVASFYHEPMCNIGRAYLDATDLPSSKRNKSRAFA